jgi:hypothetical protein
MSDIETFTGGPATPPPLVNWKPFHVPKRGYTEKQYEDYGDGDDLQGRFAVADGASESSFAKQWAKILVEKFLKAPILGEGQWEYWLPQLQRLWCEKVDNIELPWFAQPKADAGAFATLLGLTLEGDGTFRAVAVGDACLFHRRGKGIKYFPIQQSSDFNTTPPLIGSRLPPDDIVRNRKHREYVGTWKPDDVFLLMTDALAAWYMQHCETKRFPPFQIDPTQAPDEDTFRERVEALRSVGKIKDDDVTLVRIEVISESPTLA